MKLLQQLFGEGKDLSALQMCDRAVVIYFIALLMLRISGRRTFGKKTAFDNTIAIILGAILSRAVVGASAFMPTVACGLALVLLHRLLAWASLHSRIVKHFLQGASIPLYRDGKLNKENMATSLITEDELIEDMRLKANIGRLAEAEEIYMETNGEVGVVKKDY
ncbi:DUF421 domain-containing protein [Mucilaginibacter sp. BT774]|uniref:DUF421 domain-containing protein n=1 Tax=Mucilaginibacter sp. BT774 TaxID=3062276 RepID=UPI002675F0A9|nr:YetF domain-containing protein [Mucilaginibacter sp. BT774]MDO3625566.1 DUF421 domain-containing protein [Mucilaginibacter sp. BT774]